MREFAYMDGFLDQWTLEMETDVNRAEIEKALFRYFSGKFDDFMSKRARLKPENFHHIYEYAVHGTGYGNIGNKQFQLWRNKIRPVGGASGHHISWDWMPAKIRNPTYRQRRNSVIGFDEIRNISQRDFDKLLEKSRKRRYTFRWKAPMLEYGFQTTRSPISPGKYLFLPGGTGNMKGSDGGWTFATRAISDWQQPGATKGVFTRLYVYFWSQVVPAEFDSELGEKIATSIRNETLLGLRKRPLTKQSIKPIRMNLPQQLGRSGLKGSKAWSEGRKQARVAMRRHERTVKGIDYAVSKSIPRI